MIESPALEPVEASAETAAEPQEAPAETPEPPRAAPRPTSLPLLLLVSGLVFALGGVALAFFRGEPGGNDLTGKLLRAGLGPPTLLLFGVGLVAVALFAYDSRRAERALAEAIDAAAARLTPGASGAPADLADRLDHLARTIESLRPSLGLIESLARKVTDGVEATYRSSESLKERLGRLRADSKIAGVEDLAAARSSLEDTLRSLRVGIEGLTVGRDATSSASEKLASSVSERLGGLAASLGSLLRKVEDVSHLKAGLDGLQRASNEERDANRAVAGEMERLVTVVADRMGAVAEGVAALARSSGETREIRAGLERVQAALAHLSAPSAPAAFAREPVPSWEARRSEPVYAPPPPAPPAPPGPAAPAGSTNPQGILDAIQRLKSLRKPSKG